MSGFEILLLMVAFVALVLLGIDRMDTRNDHLTLDGT